ncbi:uncharacterized protein LOC125658882 [Ostrea edulis]|uniref:uncharacterized protein LOC125658882 n=1 Tax=Ostrea edulis TaxID=37623 RepID=UPI00209629DD|nr:uncharacterized protein LOC125658882 [Ostrea edulis]
MANAALYIFQLIFLLIFHTYIFGVEGRGDSRCMHMGGRCEEVNSRCQIYVSNKCAGGNTRKCCVYGQDYPCEDIGGTCQTRPSSCSGRYKRGLCGGLTNRQCCV